MQLTRTTGEKVTSLKKILEKLSFLFYKLAIPTYCDFLQLVQALSHLAYFLELSKR